MATPYATVEIAQVTSTQDEARRRFEDSDAIRPVLLIAGRQLHGRGRSGREWWSAPRAMTASVAMSEPGVHVALGVVPLVLAMAVRDAIGNVCGVTAGLKWPNDLMIGPAKVGGILAEHTEEIIVAGVGLNLWWPDSPTGTAGVVNDDPGPDMARDLAHAWADSFLRALEARTWDRDRYIAASVTLGKRIEWEPAGAGTAIGIDYRGGLIVEGDSGRSILRSGEVRHIEVVTGRTTSLASAPISDEESDTQ